MRRPPAMEPGARVALVSPAGPLRGDHDLERAIDNARSFGWEAVPGRHVMARTGYLAGTDADRLADFNRAASDDSIDAIWCVRGGYGAMRLLDQIDYASLRRRPKALIGYSDVTALHAAVGTRADLVTYHGPTARAELTDFSRASLRQTVGAPSAAPTPLAAPGARTIVGGRVRGRLVGGNLALLSALCGTPFAPSFDDAILVLEDVNEPVYRVDRMLTQLRLGGVLQRCAGLLFGAFTNPLGGEEGDDGSRTLADVMDETARALGLPAIADVPVGHIQDQWTLPLGATATLDADERMLVYS